MKRIFSTTGLLFLLYTLAFGQQQLTQTVRGTIRDAESKQVLVGARVVILNTNPMQGATTDADGNFRIEQVQIGRKTLEMSYIGYETAQMGNVVVNSAKEVLLDIQMQESIVKMTEVVITSDRKEGEAMHEMALLSAQMVSAEQTNRYAGGFNDPSKIVSNLAGVTNTQDGSNDIIVRGNSPKYVQWRLEGEPITNPNHFGDQSAVGGSISTINSQMMGNSDFFTAAFPAEFGNALSGVYDVRFRAGNNEQTEFTFGFGLLGTDLTAEGPMRKNGNGSFLLNYRYSTAAVLKQVGLLDIDGTPKFQDISFKVVNPTKRMGVFTLYGLGGKSAVDFKNITPKLWDLPGDRSSRPGVKEDYDKAAHLANLGLTHHLQLSGRSFLRTTASYGNEGVEDVATEYGTVKILDAAGNPVRDSVITPFSNFRSKVDRINYRLSSTYTNKISASTTLQGGVRAVLNQSKFLQNQYVDSLRALATLTDFDEQMLTTNSFVSVKHRLGNGFTVVAGLHHAYVGVNDKMSLEPRLAATYSFGRRNTISIGYGNHSTVEALHHYYAKIRQPEGNYTEPNRDLGLLRAHHFVAGYEKYLLQNLRFKAEVYYQHLYNLPVENDPTSFFSTIAEGLDFRYVDLVNEGTGKNYGLEITLERFLKRGFYFLANASIYESKYTALDGKERNTPYNGEFLANILFGKEFAGLGKRDNQTFAVNVKGFVGGGRKVIPLLRDAQGNLAVRPDRGEFYDYSKAYENDLQDLNSITVSLSYKWNKAKTTQEFFLNIDNVTNTKGRIIEYYDETEPNKIGYQTQFGMFPNLVYRLYF
jgi:CarboxypepD_reg-like domain/TonB-dependent Receptor Plug Domain